MRKVCAIAAGLLCAVHVSNAAVLRVNNQESAGAPYLDLQIAINEASAGDTIYVEGSAVDYESSVSSDYTVDKKLHIIGPGYLLGQNDSLLQFREEATIGDYFIFSTGAEGSIIEGLHFDDQVRANTSNIIIRNNRIDANAYIGINSNECTDILYLQNHLTSLYVYRGGDGVIKNNIVSGTITNTSDAGSELQIVNNTFTTSSTSDAIKVNGSYVVNNIMAGTIMNGTSNTLENNFTSAEDYLTNFVGPEKGDSDSKWQLLETSKFYAGATDGGQCGAFGGATPYRLSGLPNSVPQIYKIESSGTATESTGLSVTLKVKTAK